MSGSLVWSKIDWYSNPSYPWYGIYNRQVNIWGHASMQENQWIIVFSIFGSTDLAGTVWVEWLIWQTATADASGNLTLAPLQHVDLTSYGNTLTTHGSPGTISWQSQSCVKQALPSLGQHANVDVTLIINNTTGTSDINATSIYDAFLPLNVDLATGAVTSNPVAVVDVYSFYFWNQPFFGTANWEAPSYQSFGNRKLKIAHPSGQDIGRVDAIAGTCSPRHSMVNSGGFTVNYYQNVGAPGQPVVLVPDLGQYFQMPDSSGDLLFSTLTGNGPYLNMQNSLFLPTTFPASFGSARGDNGSVVIYNSGTWPYTTYYGAEVKGYINGTDNPVTFTPGASTWTVPSGVNPPPGSGQILLGGRAPDNDPSPGEICLLGGVGSSFNNGGTSTEVYRLGQSSDYSPYLISHKSYPAMDSNMRNVINTGYSDTSGNAVWLFYDSSAGTGTISDWYLWAGAFTGGAKWSIGSVLLG